MLVVELSLESNEGFFASISRERRNVLFFLSVASLFHSYWGLKSLTWFMNRLLSLSSNVTILLSLSTLLRTNCFQWRGIASMKESKKSAGLNRTGLEPIKRHWKVVFGFLEQIWNGDICQEFFFFLWNSNLFTIAAINFTSFLTPFDFLR